MYWAYTLAETRLVQQSKTAVQTRLLKDDMMRKSLDVEGAKTVECSKTVNWQEEWMEEETRDF